MRPYIAVIVVAILAMLTACSGEDGGGVNGIPPCTPVEGSDVDPCDPNRERGGNPLGHGSAGDEPRTMRSYLDGGSEISVSHMVIRATYLPGTTRCVGLEEARLPPYAGMDGYWSTSIVCFTDVRVNNYVVGSGPSKLTVEIANLVPAGVGDLEQGARNVERILVRGGMGSRFEVPEGGIEGNEVMMFVGPSRSFSFEVLRAINTWDVQRRDGGQVVAVHPHAEYWLWKDADTYRSRVERSLPDFGLAVGSAAQERANDNDGRIRPGSSYPSLVQDANRLHDYYVETGAINHPDGPPSAPPPEYCGLVRGEDALLADCEALLDGKDTLRGTGTLNWATGTALGSWDGITVGGMPQRITKVELASESLAGSIPVGLGGLTGLTHLDLSSNSLTGSIPMELGLLHNLVSLKLSGNSLTGCIPIALQSVATNDLSSLSLLYCKPPAPGAPTAGTAGEGSVPLSWTAVANTSKYRVEYREGDSGTWIVHDETVTTTSHTVDGLQCNTEHQFRVSGGA